MLAYYTENNHNAKSNRQVMFPDCFFNVKWYTEPLVCQQVAFCRGLWRHFVGQNDL